MRTAIDHGLVVHKERVNAKNNIEKGFGSVKVCVCASKGKQIEISVLLRCGAYGNVSSLGEAGGDVRRSYLFLLLALQALEST
jgi:hypothetical protein